MTNLRTLLAAGIAALFFAGIIFAAGNASAKGKGKASAVSFGEDDAKEKSKDKKDKKGKDAKPEPAQRVEAAATGDRAAGEKIYRVNCASCHGVSGGGDGIAARQFNPAPASHRNPAVMNGIDDLKLFKIIREGAKAIGRESAMPAFAGGLNELDIWDLIAYIRTLHVRIDTFMPGGAYYVVKNYRVFSPKRVSDAIKETLTPDEEELKVFTVFRFPKHDGYAELVPYEPGKMDKLKKNLKLGYIAFAPVKGPQGLVDIGMAMSPAGNLLKVMPTDLTAGQDIAKLFAKFEGFSSRMKKYEIWKVPGVTPDVIKETFKQNLRMLEAVFSYEKEEKERTWMDEE